MRGREARRVAGVLALLALCAVPLAAQTVDSTAPPPPTRRPGLKSWTTDRRDFKVGDVVTIIVDELTIASADMSNSDESSRDTQSGVGGGAVLPGSRQSGDVSFNTKINNGSDQRGQARRKDVLTTEISARVVAVEEGMLKIEGTRTLRLDKNEQSVTISGIARPEDISANNIIESWRLADAALGYSSKGDLGKPKKGILGRILGILWP